MHGQINRVKHIFDKRALIIIINALVFLTSIPRALVGYEMIDSQRGA